MADASAAACSSSMAGYASTSDSQYHDVFINHRGSDVKETFATLLYRSLTGKGLQVFLDKPEMQVGQYIFSQIEAAIRVASVHIAIFSPGYAESEWCLNELLSMVKTGNTIIPVFYKVKPEHLRRTKWTGTEKDGPYAIALRKYEQEQRHGTETIQRWREALKDVANISGLELEAFNGEEEKLLEKVVQSVLKICPPPLAVAKYPTGLEEKIEEFERTVLSEHHREHRVVAKVVGIVGLGGIGKTTLARYFFKLKRSDYERSSFLFDVRENTAEISLKSLQSRLIKDLKHQDTVIEGWEEGIETLRKNLLSCHALVILDDVDHINQLDAFLPIKDILDPKSLIVVTSRDQGVLRNAGIVEPSVYHLRDLTRAHSQQLFCSHAFSQRDPLPGFEDLVDGFIEACGGLPLSLKVLGALLCGQNEISYWKELLDGLNKLPADIENRLRISYDSLNEEEQQIFLDIACFCIGEDRDRWIRIWAGSEWKGLVGFLNLQNKCLVDVDTENSIRMHDHLRDMGRNIADSSRSMARRFWQPIYTLQDISNLLEQSSSVRTEVRGLRMVDRIHTTSSYEVLEMSKLQLLHAGGYFVKSILTWVQAPKLIWLRWNICPEPFLPSWIPMRYLKVLEVHSTKLRRLWHCESQAPPQLRELIITAPLEEFPSGQLEHLEKLVAESTHLTTLPKDFYLPSLKYLKIDSNKLKRLWQSDSQAPLQLRALILYAPRVLEFPKSLRQLKHLELLAAPGISLTPDFCYLPSLKYLLLRHFELKILPDFKGEIRKQPDQRYYWKWQVRDISGDSICNLAHLRRIKLYYGSLKVLPNFLWNLTNLQHVDLAGCESLKTLPGPLGNLANLQHVDLAGCMRLKTLPDSFVNLANLQHLDLAGCKSLKTLPYSFVNLANLQHLDLARCHRLESLPDSLGNLTSLLYIDLRFCESLKMLPNSFGNLTNLQLLAANGISLTSDFCYLPSLKYLLLRQFELKILPDFNGEIRELSDHRYYWKWQVPDISGDSICNLAHLRRIKLYYDSLEVLPNFLWNLTNLQHIDLAGCESLKRLPGSLGNLANLQHVDLAGCKSLKTLPDSFVNLTNLQHLDLARCHGLESLPDSFGNLTSLLYIDLRFCESLKMLPNSFENLTKLQHIELYHCKNLKMLPNFFGNLTDLQSIDLSFCKSLDILPNSFENLWQLEHLHLEGCSSLTISSETLGNMTKLKCLDLSCCLDNKLLPPEIVPLLSLERLNLLGTNLKELPRDLVSLSNLKVLRVGSPLLEVLPPLLGYLTNLKKLWLSDCHKLQCLPDSVELLSQLTELKIWNCGIQYLPLAVMKMNNLKLLGVYKCPLRELPFQRQVSSALFHLQKLELYRTEVLEVSFPQGVCPNLEDLRIVRCEHLVEVGALPTTLKNLDVGCCVALRKIRGVYDVAKLQTLDLRECYDIEVEELRRFRALMSSGLVLSGPQIKHIVDESNLEWDHSLRPVWRGWIRLDDSRVQQEVLEESFCDGWTPLDTDREEGYDSEEFEEEMLYHGEESEEDDDS